MKPGLTLHFTDNILLDLWTGLQKNVQTAPSQSRVACQDVKITACYFKCKENPLNVSCCQGQFAEGLSSAITVHLSFMDTWIYLLSLNVLYPPCCRQGQLLGQIMFGNYNITAVHKARPSLVKWSISTLLQIINPYMF